MDVDIALVTEIDRRKDNVIIFSTGKCLNERFTPCKTRYGLTINEDFVVPSKIPPWKDRVVFKNQKYVPVHERFASYKKHDWNEIDKKHAEMETRKQLEESLRLFSKRRRTVVSPKSSRNKQSTKPQSKLETQYSVIKGDLESTKPHKKPETNSSDSDKKMNRFSSDDSKSLAKFTDDQNLNKPKKVENESTSNSDWTFKENDILKCPCISENRSKHVPSETEDGYLKNSGSYGNHGFGRNKSFNSPFHYNRKDEVRPYTWHSLHQWNRKRPTKEQLDDEIDRYMSEVKFKPPSTEEDDLDSFVEEYIMEKEKILILGDSELVLQKHE